MTSSTTHEQIYDKSGIIRQHKQLDNNSITTRLKLNNNSTTHGDDFISSYQVGNTYFVVPTKNIEFGKLGINIL